jgi:hypothetical protein
MEFSLPEMRKGRDFTLVFAKVARRARSPAEDRSQPPDFINLLILLVLRAGGTPRRGAVTCGVLF